MHIRTARLGAIVALATISVAMPILPAQGGRQLFERFGNGFSRAGGYGTSIAVVGDVDGDFFDDIAAGDPTDQSNPSGGFGFVQVLSGVDGSVLYTMRPASADSNLGTIVAAVGDVNGDQIPDVLTSARAEVVRFSGADGTELSRLSAPLGSEPDALAGPGDWSGDQVPDLALASNGSVLIYSGTDNSTILSFGTMVTQLAAIPSGTPGVNHLAVLEQNMITLASNVVGVLWTRGGYQSVAAAGPNLVAVAAGGATVDLLSGVNGSVLLTVPGGTNASGGVDINGDGTPDIAVGDPGAGNSGAVRAYSGADGSLLFERTGQENGELMGWDVAMHSGAGPTTRPAVIVAAWAKYNGSVDAGAVLALAQAAAGELDGSFRPFGQHCNFRFTVLRAGRDFPTIGEAYGFRFDNNTTPMGFELLLLGVSKTTWSGIPLPVTLPGVTSCQLYLSIDIVVPGGFSTFQSLSFPLNAGLVGQELHLQGMTLMGYPVIETSDAATITVGN